MERGSNTRIQGCDMIFLHSLGKKLLVEHKKSCEKMILPLTAKCYEENKFID